MEIRYSGKASPAAQAEMCMIGAQERVQVNHLLSHLFEEPAVGTMYPAQGNGEVQLWRCDITFLFPRRVLE